MKAFRSIFILVSILWATEDLVQYMHPNQYVLSVAIELGSGEKVEEKIENETKEYLTYYRVPHVTFQDDLQAETATTLYQAPILAIPDVPPWSHL